MRGKIVQVNVEQTLREWPGTTKIFYHFRRDSNSRPAREVDRSDFRGKKPVEFSVDFRLLVFAGITAFFFGALISDLWTSVNTFEHRSGRVYYSGTPRYPLGPDRGT